MAENKEERIAIYVTEDKIIEGGYGDFYNTIPYKKAIERVAKGIHYYELRHHNNMPKWEGLNTDIQNDYKNMAEAAPDALLSKEDIRNDIH